MSWLAASLTRCVGHPGDRPSAAGSDSARLLGGLIARRLHDRLQPVAARAVAVDSLELGTLTIRMDIAADATADGFAELIAAAIHQRLGARR